LVAISHQPPSSFNVCREAYIFLLRSQSSPVVLVLYATKSNAKTPVRQEEQRKKWGKTWCMPQ
jgi:hypothetical protein